MIIMCALPLISGEQLDLSQWLRSGKQLSEGDGVALGLVSALQKWATSLESDSSSLKQDMDKVRETNTKLVDEVRLIRSQNTDLKNEVTQANERSMNIKSLYQKMGEQFGEIERENKELKTAFQVCSHQSLHINLFCSLKIIQTQSPNFSPFHLSLFRAS